MHTAPVPSDALAVGERIYLRRPVEADRAAFVGLVAASHEHLARWTPAPLAADDQAGARWFDVLLKANAGGSSQKFFVHRRHDAALLGCMNLNEIVRGGFQSAFLGYWIGAPHTRRGYMLDALQTVLRHAFETEGLHRVEANIQPANEPSLRLVQRAGFLREGFSPRYLHIGGAWRDHERWALTIEDWAGTV